MFAFFSGLPVVTLGIRNSVTLDGGRQRCICIVALFSVNSSSEALYSLPANLLVSGVRTRLSNCYSPCKALRVTTMVVQAMTGRLSWAYASYIRVASLFKSIFETMASDSIFCSPLHLKWLLLVNQWIFRSLRKFHSP